MNQLKPGCRLLWLTAAVFLVLSMICGAVYATLQEQAKSPALISLLYISATGALFLLAWKWREGECLRMEMRKQAKTMEEIAKSEEDLAATLASIGDGFIATDAKGRVTRMNEVAEELTGWPVADAIGHPLEEVFVIVNQESRLPVENPVCRVVESGMFVGLDKNTQLISRDGTECPIADSGAPIKDREGNIIGVVLVFRDQTEERQKERNVVEARDFYLTLLEEFPAMIRRSDLEGRCDYFNRTWLNFRGRCMDEEIGDGWYEGVHPDDLEKIRLSSIEAFHCGRTFDTTYRLLHNDGEYRWICDFGIPFNNHKGVFSGYIYTCYDISERKKSLDFLKESEKLLRQVIEATPDLIMVQDRERRIILSNWHGILQDVPQTTRDRNPACCELIHKDSAAPCDPCVHDIFVSGRSSVSEITLPGERLFEVHSNPIFNDSGAIDLVVRNFRDITEQRRTEEQLRHSQKMEAIGTLAGGIAHDFNNILTAIVGYGTILQTKLDKDDPHRDDLGKILASADRATTLTRGLLAYSRKNPISLRTVDLNDIIKKIEHFLSRIIGEDIEISIIPAMEELLVQADPGQIEQVIMNLATNARDAMLSGGKLLITAWETVIDDDFILNHGYGKKGRYALLTISDNGSGMDKPTQERIFEPFFTTKEVGQGTGLGLAIVYGIVKQHKGYINLYSDPEKGTTFRVYLPLTTLSTKDRRRIEQIPAKGNGETVLIIEDNEEIRTLFGIMLKEYGYRVIDAIDGEEGVDVFLRHRDEIDLILLDVVMPRKNGKMALEEIRSIAPESRALFMSGYTADIISAKGIDTEGVVLLTKPFSPFELLNKVREILDQPLSRASD
jgi:PAS domain S-box-containing protein